jgi:glucose-6-phosphate isomerase
MKDPNFDNKPMNPLALWQLYQDWLYVHPDLGFYLDISRMRVSETLGDSLAPKFAKAFQDMEALEKGAIANPDEGRMVGHYWLRDPDIAPSELKNQIQENLEHIEDFARKVHSGRILSPEGARFTDIISIGIGGSALGPEFVAEALSADDSPLAIHFIDNTDPAGIDRVLNRLRNRLSSTLVIVISKSGGTPETRNAMFEVRHAYERQGLDFLAHAVAISRQDTLDRIEGCLDEFPMFEWVGGRTSEMSSVGLLSAALLGIDIRAMLAGAREMDIATRVPEIKRNPAALLALAWYSACNGKGEKDMVVLPYKDSLLLFSRYLQQLVMESLGKEKDLAGNIVHQGLTVYGNKGSTDQHAYVQQLREGVKNFFATFIEVLEDRAGPSIEIEPDATAGDFLSGFLHGTRNALFENSRESITLTINRVDARSVGALIALYERAVGFYASLININAYHQPGVEAGKKAAASLLKLQRDVLAVLRDVNRPLRLAALAEKAGAGDRIEDVYKIVRHMAANRRGVDLQGELGKPGELTVVFNRNRSARD